MGPSNLQDAALRTDLKDAMRSKDAVRMRVVRSLLAAFKAEEG